MARIEYDVFLSHSSADTPIVEELARRLAREGLRPWLDVWKLVPGGKWQPALEQALQESAACAVLIGAGGLAPWQDEEMRAAISRRVTGGDTFRVLPVLLPGVGKPEKSKLPAFLVAHSWIEFHRSLDEPETFRRLVCGIRGIETGPGKGKAAFDGICPYRGLHAFEVEHAPLFFGREELTAKLLDDLRRTPSRPERRFLAIIAASGSGKSSLAKAGLAAAIRAGKLEGSQDWPMAIVRPGHEPIEALAVGLMGTVLPADRALVYDRLAGLKDGPRSLHVATNQILGVPPRAERLVVLVDQFEEVFTHCTDDAIRRAYFANLLHAATAPGGRTIVLLTMRADFYGRCASYSELATALSRGHELVGPMTDDELRSAIERPARLAGLEPEPGLVEVLVRDVKSRSGALPLLQFALKEIWQCRTDYRLTVQAYHDIGLIEGALQRKADAIYSTFTTEQREQCRRTFLRLVEPGEGTEDTKRRVARDELEPLDPARADVVTQVLDRLTQEETRLLTADGGTIEMAHEALVRGWPRLRQWIEADRAGLRIHRRLTEAAHEWDAAPAEKRPDFLVAGARLAEATEWAESHRDELSQVEQSFLDASRQAEEKRRRDKVSLWRRIAAGSVAAVMLLIGLSVYSVWASLIARENERVAIRQAIRARSVLLASQSRENLSNRPQLALLLAFESLRGPVARDNNTAALDHPLAALTEAVNANQGRALLVDEGGLSELAYSPDGKQLATVGYDGTVRLLDLTAPDPTANPFILRGRSANPRIMVGHKTLMHGLAYRRDGKQLATAGDDGTVQLWDLTALNAAAQPLVLRGHEGAVSDVTYRPDGKQLASFGEDKTVRLWNLTALNPAANPLILREREGAMSELAYRPDGKQLAIASNDGTVRLWDLTARDPNSNPLILQVGKKPATAVPDGTVHFLDLAYRPDGKQLATAVYDGTVRLLDLTAMDPTANPLILRGHEGCVDFLAYRPDGKQLATAGEDRTVQLWDLTARDPAANPIVLHGHEGCVMGLAYRPDGAQLASAGQDGTVRLLDRNAPDPNSNPIILRSYIRGISNLAYHPDGKQLAIAGYDETVCLLDLTAPDPTADPLVLRGRTANPAIFVGTKGLLHALAYRPDGNRLATAGDDGTVQLWDLTVLHPAANPLVLRGHKSAVLELAYRADGMQLATASDDGTVQLWDLTAPRPSARSVVLRGHEVNDLAYRPDGKQLATTGTDATVRLLDLTAFDPSANPLTLHGDLKMSRLAYRPDGKQLATSGDLGMVFLLDLRLPDPYANPIILRRNQGFSSALAYRTDGKQLATAGDDGQVHLWDLTAPNPDANPLMLRGHVGVVSALAYRPDGKQLATTAGGGALALWTIDPIELIQLARRDAYRNLSWDEWQQFFPGEPYRRTFEDLPVGRGVAEATAMIKDPTKRAASRLARSPNGGSEQNRSKVR